ncbi:hypothetical protein VTK56DRAFT_1365 [Thermocarpiscus australiensis]
MCGRFAPEAQAGATARQGSYDEVQAPPGGNAGNAQERQTMVPQSEEEVRRRLLQYAHQHQHQRQQQSPSRPAQSPSSPTDTPSPDQAGESSPRQTVERLACKLSKHNLQLNRHSHSHSYDQLEAQPQPWLLASPEGLPSTSELPRSQRSQLVMKDRSRQHLPAGALDGYTPPWLTISAADTGSAIDVDEAYMEQPDDRRPDMQRPRRQPGGQSRGGVTGKGTVDLRLEGMIASGTQCNVRSEPPPISTPLPPTAPLEPMTRPSFLEADADCAMASWPLEADDPDIGKMPDVPRDGAAPAEGRGVSLRSASGPRGVRKYTIDGIELRYQLSADAALRCANLVRSRPRMRKRHKTQHGSSVSSAATSSVPSPVILPQATPPSIPPAHPPPP